MCLDTFGRLARVRKKAPHAAKNHNTALSSYMILIYYSVSVVANMTSAASTYPSVDGSSK